MHKIWVIAVREYRAAVRSKAFIVTLVLMPILMGGSIALQALFMKLEGTKDRTYAVIDRTPGRQLSLRLWAAAEVYNRFAVLDPDTGKQVEPRIVLQTVEPSADDPEAIARQRYEQSQRIEQGEIDGLLEIGPDVLAVRPLDPAAEAHLPPEAAMRFQTKKPNDRLFPRFAERAVNAAVQMERFEQAGLEAAKVAAIQQPVPLRVKGLTKRDPATGAIEDASDASQVANFVLPPLLIGLMFMIIMVGATPAMQGVVEEKGQRIAEVLLGSVTPFQLMAGKLLGVVGVSLTMAAVYLGGGYFVADRFHLAGLLPASLLAWFLLFTVLALLIYGSLFIAIGASVTEIKETQTLLMPVMLIACLPLFALGPIMQEPNGMLATAFSFVPFSTPMLLVARQAVPPGVPGWQMAAGIALVLLATLACVWAAGRIFRVGILNQGKGARFKDLIQWVVRG